MATSFRLAGPGKTARRWLAGGTAAAIVMLGVPVVGIAPASADNNFGPFEIDANLVLDGGTDWASFSGNGDQGMVTILDNTTGTQDDTTFQGSAKEYEPIGSPGAWPTWNYGGGKAPDKSDIGRAAVWTATEGSSVYTYLAFDRAKDQGTLKFAFELNQVKQSGINANPTRSQGDIRFIIWDQGGGSLSLTGDNQNTDVGMYVWDDPDVPNKSPLSNPTVHGDYPAGPVDGLHNPANPEPADGKWVKITPPSAGFLGKINQVNVEAPDWWTSPNVVANEIESDRFVEVAFDLQKLGAVLGCPSSGYGAANLRSITGTGGPGTLVDYVEAMSVRVPSECSSLVINKYKAGTNNSVKLPGATFEIMPDPTPVAAGQPIGASLIVTDGQAGDADGVANGTVSINPARPDTYTVKETVAPLGYILVTPNTSEEKKAEAFKTPPVFNFQDPLGKIRWLKEYEGGLPEGVTTGATFQVVRSGSPTLTNAQFQTITGKSSQTFPVIDNGTNDDDPDLGQIQVNGLPVGTYTVTETAAPAGFSPDSMTAVATIPATLATLAAANDPFDAKDGSDGTFNNPRNTGKLAIKKTSLATGAEVKVGVGGITTAAQFQLYRVVGTLDTASSETNDQPIGGLVDAPATVSGLAWGESYYFVEVSAPAPYNVPDKNWTDPYLLTAADADAGTVAKTLSIADPETTITTVATPNVTTTQVAPLPNAKISDSATVSGLNSKANGTVTFKLYYSTVKSLAVGTTPSSICTAGTLVSGYTSSAKIGAGTAYPVVNGSVTVPSAQYTATKAGFYYWVASYTGDGFNSDAAGICGDPLEVSEVVPAVSGIVTTAGGDANLAAGDAGAALYDTAKLTGLSGLDATGTITFNVYKGTTCSAAPIDTIVVDIAGTVLSDGKGGFYTEVSTSSVRNVIVYEAGTYTWTAAYEPLDGNNTASAEQCGANPAEQWTVGKASPALVTDTRLGTGQDLTLPSTSVTDTATVTGLTTNATGNVTFELYAATDATCAAAPIFTSKVSVTGKVDASGNATITSEAYTGIVAAGTYKWVAVYEGDVNNNATPRPACGLVDEDNYEISVIEKATPTIVTTATDGAIAAGATTATITDTAVVKGLAQNATGKVEFSVYGPYATQAEAEACVVTGKLVTTVSADLPGTNAQGGQQTVGPVSVDVLTSGYYAWKATYKGDANNNEATHDCGEQTGMDEISYVPPRQPAITTVADQTVNLPLNQQSVTIFDTATITGLTGDATGDVIFSVYGPSDAQACTVLVGSVTVPLTKVSADGTAIVTSGTGVAVTAPGKYWWIASYTGDTTKPQDNLTVSGKCGDANETTTVTRANPGIAKIASVGETIISGTVPDGEGTKELEGRVDLDTAITYTVTVSNTGDAEASGPVVDTLPLGLGKPSDVSLDSEGDAATVAQLPAGNWQITWNSITVAPNEPVSLSYKAVVLRSEANPDVPVNATLINTATWLGLQDSTKTLVKYLTVVATPFCDADTPKVEYTVTPVNLDPSIQNWTTDLTWFKADGVTPVDPNATTINGQPVTLNDLPLQGGQLPSRSGALLYPGTKVVNGVTVDWPGWINEGTVDNPIWKPQADGLTPAAKLRAEVNPTGTSQVVYPPATDACFGPPGVPSFTKTSPTAVGSTERPTGNVVTGEKVHYVLTLINNGGKAVTAPLTDTLPAGVTNPTAFTVTPSAGFTATPTVTGQKLDWGSVTVAAGQTVKFEFDVTVSAQPDPGAIEDLINNAAWGALPGQTRHIVAGPGVEIVPTLTKTADPATGSVVKVGDVITYTVKVGNNGNVALTDDLVDTLPAGIEVVGNYTRDDGGQAEPDTATATTLTWNDVTVQPGQVVTFTYEIKVLDSAQDQDSLVNTAEWLGLKGGTEHTVSVPTLPQTGGGFDPLTTVGWAGALLVLGLVFLLWGRRRDEQA